MIIKYRDLKIKILKMVLLYIIFVSFISIFGILYYHYITIEDSVKSMAEKESKDLVVLFKQINDGFSDYSVRRLEGKIVEKLKRGHLHYVKFYKTSLKEIKTINRLGKKRIFHLDIKKLLLGKNNDILNIGLNGISLETILPIKDSVNKNVIGYIALGYDVPKEKIKKIKDGVILTLILVLFGVILISLFLIPIIFRLNSSLINHARELIDSRVQTIMVLGKAISKRDTDTGLHNYRVTLYSVAIAEKLKLDIDSIKDLIKGSFLHDIGKIAIRDSVLLKPGKLDDDEFEEMKQHVKYGVEIIEELAWLGNSKDVVRYHHERYDGKGYLEGLSGEDIPKNAMIFAIADVFDALTSKRPYKEPFGYEKSIEIMKAERGKHFDPEILDAFLDISEELYYEISTISDEDELKRKLYEVVMKYGYFEIDCAKS